MADLSLIVGLGNPGPQYAHTRHNVGFRALDQFARQHGLRFNRREAESLVASGTVSGVPVLLGKPQTYMNLSGRAVRGLLSRHRLLPDALMVIYDDLDLPLGRIRLRERGSAGGHRGVQSIIEMLGGNEFRRIRVGIGRPQHGDPIEYVLESFHRDEEPVMRLVWDTVVEAIEDCLAEGFQAAMNRYNRDAIVP